MRSIFLLALLLALCAAAPVDKHGEKVFAKDDHVHEVAENPPADNHEENSSAKDDHEVAENVPADNREENSSAKVDHERGEKVKEGTPTDDLHREEKFFSHNEFELGDIGVSGTAEGGSISIGHQIEIDVHGHSHSHAVHGGYTEWSAWSDCSESCVRGHGHGHGTKKRSRTCTNPQPEYDGLTCEEQNLGPATETKECYVGPCPVNGGYTAWSEYGDCSVSCGDGIKIRSRTCTKPEPQHDGLTCEDQSLGPATETKECNLRPCPVNGGYTAWGEYGDCSVSCGDGIKIRSRTCSKPEPQHDGLTCEEQNLGPATETKECNLRPCPVNGGYTAWSAYGACGTTCGDGIETRSRTCTSPKPQHGGLTCEEQKLGPATETKDCNLRPCPVNGGYTEWSTYGACSVSCGDGTHSRSRTCTRPKPQHGGQTCEDQNLGLATETKECNLRPCPVNGGYTAWSEYGDCSVTCGDGIQLRSRTCTNPETKHGGLTCEENLGPDTEFKECNPGRCPDCSCSDVVKAGGFGNCEKEFDSMGFICWVNMPSTCSDIQENSMDPGNFYSAEACKSEKVGFEACVDDWCLQDGTDEQYTRCEAATDGGDTCINPLIKYGTTEGGIPIDEFMWNYNTYCKMFFNEERIGSVKTGKRDCSVGKGYVYWCAPSAGSDEDEYKWCDYEGDGEWKDGSLDDLVDPDNCLSSSITSYSCKTEKVGFEACVDDWCLQDGTDEQYTRCEAATDGGDTCINPLIKYGTTEGGIPIDDPMDYNAYCKMIFHEERIGSVTSGERDCSAAKGYVYWCEGGDEDGYKWCDYEGDGKWKDGSLDDLVDSDDCSAILPFCHCSAITSYSCKTGDL